MIGDGATGEFRVGIGEDRHALADGGPLGLGGVSIPHTQHLVGHSDADAVLHAATDAILGAAAAGDIGELFPDADPANRGRDSAEMLAEALRRVAADGWAVVNLDLVIHAQQPKLGEYKAAIRERLAEILGVDVDRVGVKAKTGERLGPVGRGEAIDVTCVVLLGR